MRELSSQTAAKRAGVVPATIINWCKNPRLKVGNLSMGKISLGEWKINQNKLQLMIDGDRDGLIKELFQEKVEDLFEKHDTLMVYFEEMDDVFYLNMFRAEIQYYGRRRNLDLSAEVPFLTCPNASRTEIIPIPLPKIKLVDALEEMGFEKTKNIYILRSDDKKRKQE